MDRECEGRLLRKSRTRPFPGEKDPPVKGRVGERG